MIFYSVGLPGALSQWCDAIIAGMAGLGGGEVAIGSWPALDELFGYEAARPILESIGSFLLRNNTQHFVIGLRQPSRALWRLFAESNTRFVLALDDPASAAASLMNEVGSTPKLAARAVAKSCPFIMQFNGLPGAVVIDADLARGDPGGAISIIADHFGIAVDRRTVAAILATVGPPGDDAWRRGGQSLGERFSPATCKMIEGALSGYQKAFRTGNLEQIVWTRDLFLLASDPGRSPTEPIDVTGGSRFLIYGPYIHLPAGSWSAQVVLGFSLLGAATFEVDVFADVPLATTSFVPHSPGIHSLTLTFSIDEPGGKGVEVRVRAVSNEAAGSLALGQVILQPFTTTRTHTADPANAFESVLEL